MIRDFKVFAEKHKITESPYQVTDQALLELIDAYSNEFDIKMNPNDDPQMVGRNILRGILNATDYHGVIIFDNEEQWIKEL